MDGTHAALLYGALSRATRRTGGFYRRGFVPSDFDVPAAQWDHFLIFLGLELGGTFTVQIGSGTRSGRVLIYHGSQQVVTLSREMVTLPEGGRGIRVGFIEPAGTGGDAAPAAPDIQQPVGTVKAPADEGSPPAESPAPPARATRGRKAQAASS